MEIKEAVEIVRKNKDYNGCLTKNSWEEVNEAFNIIEKAIADGYTLCKVDKAIENIKRYSRTLGTRYSNVEQDVISTQEAIDVIKEACE